MIAKTVGQRKIEERARRAEAGLTRLEVWAHPEDHEQIKALAAKLVRKRQRDKKPAP